MTKLQRHRDGEANEPDTHAVKDVHVFEIGCPHILLDEPFDPLNIPHAEEPSSLPALYRERRLEESRPC
jgi:hypothetical protein